MSDCYPAEIEAGMKHGYYTSTFKTRIDDRDAAGARQLNCSLQYVIDSPYEYVHLEGCFEGHEALAVQALATASHASVNTRCNHTMYILWLAFQQPLCRIERLSITRPGDSATKMLQTIIPARTLRRLALSMIEYDGQKLLESIGESTTIEHLDLLGIGPIDDLTVCFRCPSLIRFKSTTYHYVAVCRLRKMWPQMCEERVDCAVLLQQAPHVLTLAKRRMLRAACECMSRVLRGAVVNDLLVSIQTECERLSVQNA